MRSYDLHDADLTDNPGLTGSPIPTPADNTSLSQGSPIPSVEVISYTGARNATQGDTDTTTFNERVLQLHATLDYDIEDLEDLREFLRNASEGVHQSIIILGCVCKYVLSDQ